MKKVKVFFVAAALVLVTAGVFAGKSRFVTGTATNLYYLLGSTYELLASGIGTSNFEYSTTAVSDQVTIDPNQAGASGNYGVFYTPNGTNYYEVYIK